MLAELGLSRAEAARVAAAAGGARAVLLKGLDADPSPRPSFSLSSLVYGTPPAEQPPAPAGTFRYRV